MTPTTMLHIESMYFSNLNEIVYVPFDSSRHINGYAIKTEDTITTMSRDIRARAK